MNALAVLERTELSWEDRAALLAYEVSLLPAAISRPDDFNVRHVFKDEWYIREFSLPAGAIFVGRVHRHGHIVKLLDGKVQLIMESGRREFTAPEVIHTQPGFISICVVLTDMTAQSWHFNPAGCRDIDELEAEHFGSPLHMLIRGEQLWSAQLQLQ